MFRKLKVKESTSASASKLIGRALAAIDQRHYSDATHRWTSSFNPVGLQTKALGEWTDQMKEQKEDQYKTAIGNLEYQLEQQQKMAEMYREQVAI